MKLYIAVRLTIIAKYYHKERLHCVYINTATLHFFPYGIILTNGYTKQYPLIMVNNVLNTTCATHIR